MGNVVAMLATLPAASDQQTFYCDEQNWLTKAPTPSRIIPCSGTNTAGMLGDASYIQTLGLVDGGTTTTM